jgi:hypothetical protein
MSSESKEYRIDACAKLAAKFFLRCKRNPDPKMRVKFPAAMKAKGYSKEESKDRILGQQVCQEVAKSREWDPPPSPEAAAVAATALLTLLAHPNALNRALLCRITPAPPVTASNVAPAVEGGALASILLPSLPQ